MSDFETVPVGTLAELERVRVEWTNGVGMKSYEAGSKRFLALIRKGVTHWVPVNSARALKAERDEHEQARTALEEALGQVMAERDALAAHIETIRAEVQAEPASMDMLLSYLDAWLLAEPTDSLASLKAEWQAEALELAADDFGQFRGMEHAIQPDELKERAAELRRQAEDPDQ